MSRYLLGAFLGLIALFTIYGISNSPFLRSQGERGIRASRDAISATSASAEDLEPLERAGRNVVRQVSEEAEAITQAQPTVIAQPQTTVTETEPAAPQPTPQPTQATQSAPPSNQEAIPALW